MQTCHIRALLKHVVSFAKPFMVLGSLYVNHKKMEYFETGLV